MRLGVLRGWFAAGIVSTAIASGPALAGNDNGGNNNNNDNPGTSRAVPEFDTAAIGAIAAIVAGGGVLLARRRKAR